MSIGQQTEYFQKWMHARAKIQRDARMLECMQHCLRGLYFEKGNDIEGEGYKTLGFPKEKDTPPTQRPYVKAHTIGQGDHHIGFSGMHVALRCRFYSFLPKNAMQWPYNLDDGLAEEVGAFELGFDKGLNPPSFTGVVRMDHKDCEYQADIAAIVVEDITEGGKFGIRGGIGEECYRPYDGKRFYVDPDLPSKDKEENVKRGRRYLAKDAVIDLDVLLNPPK